jgi:hypothetical protein
MQEPVSRRKQKNPRWRRFAADGRPQTAMAPALNVPPVHVAGPEAARRTGAAGEPRRSQGDPSELLPMRVGGRHSAGTETDPPALSPVQRPFTAYCVETLQQLSGIRGTATGGFVCFCEPYAWISTDVPLSPWYLDDKVGLRTETRSYVELLLEFLNSIGPKQAGRRVRKTRRVPGLSTPRQHDFSAGPAPDPAQQPKDGGEQPGHGGYGHDGLRLNPGDGDA